MAKRKKEKAAKEPEEPAAVSLTQIDKATANQLRNVGSKRDIEDVAFKASDLYLTDSEVAELEALKIRLKHFQAASEKRELARAFRILDLPPEIRVRIYCFVFEYECHKQNEWKDVDESNRLLADAIPPAIVRVCGTFRKECLPLFFSATKFTIPIATNLIHRAMYRIDGELVKIPEADKDIKRSGVLNLKKSVKDTIRSAGDAAVFRDINFEVYEANCPRRMDRHRTLDLYLKCDIDLRRGRLQVNVTECDFHPSVFVQDIYTIGSNYRYAKLEDVEVMIQEIRRIAAEIEARENCEGLKLKDIERIAKVFRFKEPIKAPIERVEDPDDQDDKDDQDD